MARDRPGEHQRYLGQWRASERGHHRRWRRLGVRRRALHRRSRMIKTTIDQLIADGWLYAALRVTFIALIYLFLFVVLRSTMRELAVAARSMPGDERRAVGSGLIVLEAAESSLALGAALSLEPVSTLGRVAGNTIVID